MATLAHRWAPFCLAGIKEWQQSPPLAPPSCHPPRLLSVGHCLSLHYQQHATSALMLPEEGPDERARSASRDTSSAGIQNAKKKKKNWARLRKFFLSQTSQRDHNNDEASCSMFSCHFSPDSDTNWARRSSLSATRHSLFAYVIRQEVAISVLEYCFSSLHITCVYSYWINQW